MTCKNCNCKECKPQEQGKKDCVFCNGTGQLRDKLGFFACVCVRHGQRTG